MEPTPGGQLEALVLRLADPTVQIVARLAKAPIGVPEAQVVLADLVEADFPGYAAVPLVANLDDAIDEETYGELSPQVVGFDVGAIVTPQRLSHLYVTAKKGDGPVSLLTVISFTNPVNVWLAGQRLEFEIGLAAIETPD